MTSIKAEEVPRSLYLEVDRDHQLRCPHFNQKLGRTCNRMLCVGRASVEPQEFKCPNCGEKTIFKRIDRE